MCNATLHSQCEQCSTYPIVIAHVPTYYKGNNVHTITIKYSYNNKQDITVNKYVVIFRRLRLPVCTYCILPLYLLYGSSSACFILCYYNSARAATPTFSNVLNLGWISTSAGVSSVLSFTMLLCTLSRGSSSVYK